MKFYRSALFSIAADTFAFAGSISATVAELADEVATWFAREASR